MFIVKILNGRLSFFRTNQSFQVRDVVISKRDKSKMATSMLVTDVGDGLC